MKDEFDFVIVGAGSAGCVLANRLTASGAHSVLLLEAGGSDRSIFIQMPTALSIPMNTEKYAWQFHTEPESGLDGREMHCPRGKVLGGSSSINGMVYVRGHARDFDEWAEQGAHGWDYAHCLPYFKKAESWAFGADDYRGGDGPLATNNGNNMKNPLYRAFIKAGVEAGYLETPDYNAFQQEGFGPMHMTIKDGVRWSTSNAYLRPALARPNLTVRTGVRVEKLILEGGRATGITYTQNGIVRGASSRREVILSAGPIGTPHIMQLSGIGPADTLKAAGIEVKHELPGVGENLQDHLEFYFQFKCRQPITLNGQLDWFHKGLIGARWFLTKKGLGATNHFESCGFIRSKPGIKWPDMQYHFLPAAIRYDGKSPFSGHGFQVHVGHNKPKSRGHVRARSANPCEAPGIRFNYLTHTDDVEGFRACVRLTREIINQPVFDSYRGEEIQPGTAVTSDGEIDAFVRQAVESAYHPSCSCKMGTDDMAVVDPEAKVHGLEGLRIVDSSVFPTITNGNLNAPTIMVAERVADLILGHTPLAPDNQPTFDEATYKTSQRPNTPTR
ncbi:choline dehydrogenase [Kordiimonas aestuarii]|uniref:choline dehydrogenase n=1 Tax=Kordiimonas aestuarii TaxID=1005925 RepID=UPI0021CF3863|nr:choline dehydrogenase [Kordiimonas aestuarii]